MKRRWYTAKISRVTCHWMVTTRILNKTGRHDGVTLDAEFIFDEKDRAIRFADAFLCLGKQFHDAWLAKRTDK